MFTALVILAYVLELLILALGVWRGYKLGLYKSIIRTVYLILIIPISILISNAISHSVAKVIVDLIRASSNATLSSLVKASPETFKLVEALASAVIFAVAFAILFGILELISLIKFNAIASKMTDKFENPEKSKATKLGGVGVGLLNGALSASILLIPLCLVVSLLGTSDSEALATLHVPTDNHVHRDETYYVNIPSSLLLRRVTQISDKDIPEEYAELKHMHVNFVDEGPDIINEAGYALNAYAYAHDHGKDNKESILIAIGAANAHEGNSKALPAIFANIMKHAVDAWDHGDAFLGINLNFNNAVAKAFVSKTLDALRNVNTGNVHSIIDTLMGDGEHDGVMSNVLVLQQKTKDSNNNEEAHTTITTLKENSELVADTLLQLGKDDDLQSVNELVAEIGSDYVSEIISDIFVNKEKVNDFAETVTNHAKENIVDSEIKTEDYEEHVSDIAQIIKDTSDTYNYPITDAESTILSVGLISYISQTEPEDMTPESLLDYFGFNINQ